MLDDFRKFKGWKLLEFFLGNRDEKASIRELSRKLQISSMTSKHYCDVFERSGFLKSERIGNAKLFFLDPQSAKVRQFRVAYALELMDEIDLAGKINNPFYVFGSIAAGTWGKESDFDLFIIKIREFDRAKVEEAISRMGFQQEIIVVDYFKLDKFTENNKQLISEVKKGIYLGDGSHEL
jgi:predicted nucleotidyltransferase